MITKTSSITTSAIHGFAIGDKIAIDVPDTRWWKRFYAWVLCRPKPTVKKYYKCVGVGTSTLQIKPLTKQ